MENQKTGQKTTLCPGWCDYFDIKSVHATPLNVPFYSVLVFYTS